MRVRTQGRLLREAVRAMLSEAELGTFEPDTGRVAHKNPAATTAASHAEALRSLVPQDISDNLQALSAINDLLGFITNFAKGRLRYIGFIFDTTALLTAVVQFSLAKERYEAVLAQQEELDPAQRAEVLDAYETAYQVAGFFLGMSILGYVGALMDMVEIRSGTFVEGVFKLIKWGGYGLSGFDFFGGSIDNYRASKAYLKDVYRSIPEDMKLVSTQMNDVIEQHGADIVQLAEETGHPDVARAARMYIEFIPAHREWVKKRL